jgi:hypothetical protein
MSHPYIKLENTELWHAVERAVSMLEADRHLDITKSRESVIGFICHQLDARGLVKPEGFESRADTEGG